MYTITNESLKYWETSEVYKRNDKFYFLTSLQEYSLRKNTSILRKIYLVWPGAVDNLLGHERWQRSEQIVNIYFF